MQATAPQASLVGVRRALAEITPTLSAWGVKRVWYDPSDASWLRCVRVMVEVADPFDLPAWRLIEAALAEAVSPLRLDHAEWRIEVVYESYGAALAWPLAIEIAALRERSAAIAAEADELVRIVERARRRTAPRPIRVADKAPSHSTKSRAHDD